MSKIKTVTPWLKQFFSEHVVTERNLSRNTRDSYRDTFNLLLPFVSGKVRKPIDRLTVEDLAIKRILQFLSDLEENRGCSVQTRNQRLSAIRAFARVSGCVEVRINGAHRGGHLAISGADDDSERRVGV